MADAAPSAIDLYWIPLGAGGRVVPRCGRAYERLSAHAAHRRAQPLFHAALELTAAGGTYVVEMAPAWHVPAGDRGVVLEGPVGLRLLGRLPAFRYEVRCWRGGRIPDRRWAVGGPVRMTCEPAIVAQAQALVRHVPALTWGRDELGAGDMWNSNSLVAWLLASVGLDVAVPPPAGGRAPGWRSGLVLAAAACHERPARGWW